jgi:hypothetical protein
MIVGALLHAKVPTFATSEIHQLFDEHVVMLAGNARRRAVRKTLTFVTVAGDALSEQHGAALEIGYGTECRLILGERGQSGGRDARQN